MVNPRAPARASSPSSSRAASRKSGKQYKSVASLLDRAVSKGIVHKNTAARKKHRLHKQLPGGKKPS
jgi:ribosomal protein S20